MSAQPTALGRATGGRRLVLWRHGRTTWNAEGRFQGQTDVDLDPTGVAQAERAGPMLAGLGPARVVASDLRRAQGTAAPLARATGLEVALDPGLRETHAGRWQGLRMAEIRERFPDEVARWDAGDPDVRPGGGESRRDVAARTTAALHRALEGVPDGGTVVAVTHGGAARIAVCAMLGWPTEVWNSLAVLSNCSWSLLAEGAHGWRLVEHGAGTLPEPVLSEEG
ncbi:histidine phosphatase family protein [Vallicoccus soli]|uniref:histidine phosphatase family protein n=1 Tax=Vallicoccus soli TaxID=2339232 RepID=UPI003CCC850B